MALLESDAAVRRAAHQRLRDSLRLLTGTRSFHNFCPHFHDSSDGKSSFQLALLVWAMCLRLSRPTRVMKF